MTQPTNFSVTTTKTPAASTPGGAAAKSPQAAGVVEARERTIAPPTTFNTETGLREDVKGGWTGKDGEKPAPAAKPKSGAEGKPAPTRHETWLAEQKAAREAREAKKTAKTAESQALARDFLKKGDLAGAANSLGMPSSELRELLLGGLLTTPTPDKELTPEQKKAADEEAFRASVLAHQKDVDAFKNATIRASYIKDKILPALADAAKYEFLHNEGVEKSAAYAYDFMNAHYQKTREELSISDVLSEMEKTLEKNFVASVERAKKMKKAERYFRPSEEEVVAEADQPDDAALATRAAEEDRFHDRSLAGLREAAETRFPAHQEEPEGDEVVPPRQAVRRDVGSKVPFAMLTPAEKRAILAAEDRAARRA